MKQPEPPKPVAPAQVKIQMPSKDEDLVDDEIAKMNDAARENGRKNK
jgi:hypothetical protein